MLAPSPQNRRPVERWHPGRLNVSMPNRSAFRPVAAPFRDRGFPDFGGDPLACNRSSILWMRVSGADPIMTSIDNVLEMYGNGITADDFADQLGDVMPFPYISRTLS